MRTISFSLVVAVAAAAFGAFGLACSSAEEEGTDVTSNLEGSELAHEALKIMGAPQIPRESNDAPSCAFTGCHSVNPVTLRQWRDQYKEAMTVLKSNKTNDEKIAYFRQNPNNPNTGFAPERIGVMTAGAHLGLSAHVKKSQHPLAYAQGELLAEIFRGKEALYKEFRAKMLMPVLADYPRLDATQYETVLKWFSDENYSLPHLTEIMPDSDRPTKCEDNFDALKARTSDMKTKTWSAKNAANRVPMFGCTAPDPANPASAKKCFDQQKDGKDIFPNAEATDFGKGWAKEGSTVRVLRAFSSPNSFWVRTSADGRFVATGGGREGGAQAMDLAATLAGAQERDIFLDASYDPDFYPDNKAFMFQSGTKVCAQSLLEKPETKKVTFGERECSSLSEASGLYQTVGQVVGDNSIGDRFILYSIWAGDSGQYSASAVDTPARAGEDSAINIFTAVAKGNDVEEGYKVRGDAFEIKTPFRGDTMMGRSGTLIGSRVAYGEKDGKTAAGYAIEGLKRTVSGSNATFELQKLGNVCLRGNKANFSFDERFLTTHHYNEPGDFAGESNQAYKEKGSSDIWVVDFVTGQKKQVTKMNPGQFALYPHFRSDGWLYFLVVDQANQTYRAVASDWAIRQTEASPTP